jgi:hypothetical protein
MPTTIDSAGITFNDATSLTSANIGTAQLVNGSVTAAKLGTTEQGQIAKAWVNFNGTTSPGTIRSSFNVSSVTKVSLGEFQVNFATPMADANYVPLVTGNIATSQQSDTSVRSSSITTSSFQIRIAFSGVLYDSPLVTLVVFGN